MRNEGHQTDQRVFRISAAGQDAATNIKRFGWTLMGLYNFQSRPHWLEMVGHGVRPPPILLHRRRAWVDRFVPFILSASSADCSQRGVAIQLRLKAYATGAAAGFLDRTKCIGWASPLGKFPPLAALFSQTLSPDERLNRHLDRAPYRGPEHPQKQSDPREPSGQVTASDKAHYVTDTNQRRHPVGLHAANISGLTTQPQVTPVTCYDIGNGLKPIS